MIGIAIAGIGMGKTIPIDDKIDISKSANVYSYETKSYSDGNSRTCILVNETKSYCYKNINHTDICKNVQYARQIGCGKTDEELKMIIERDIKIKNDIANRPPVPTVTKIDKGDIVLTSQKAEGLE